MESLGAIATPLCEAAALLLLFIAALHFYWAFGGRKGLDVAIPTEGDRFVFKPGPLSCFVVGFGLLLVALVLIVRVGLLGPVQGRLLYEWATWALVFIFLLRALGDFRYVGFSKKIWETRFARLDTFIYSPVCLFIAFAAFAAAMTPLPTA
jgi:hypothetical protein